MMKVIEYELFPEAFGSNGNFLTKKGTVGELIVDTGMLSNSDYDKVIPPLPDLNKLLMQGTYPRAGEWNPFTLTRGEYIEVMDYLIKLPLPRPYRSGDCT